MLENVNVILASASPRRTELLTQAGIRHKIIVSDCEEHAKAHAPEEYVMELAGIAMSFPYNQHQIISCRM